MSNSASHGQGGSELLRRRRLRLPRRVRSRSESVESTYVLRDPFKVGTVTRGPLRLRNVGTLSHVQPLRNEGFKLWSSTNEGFKLWSSTNEGFRSLCAHSIFRFCTYSIFLVFCFAILQVLFYKYRFCFTTHFPSHNHKRNVKCSKTLYTTIKKNLQPVKIAFWKCLGCWVWMGCVVREIRRWNRVKNLGGILGFIYFLTWRKNM